MKLSHLNLTYFLYILLCNLYIKSILTLESVKYVKEPEPVKKDHVRDRSHFQHIFSFEKIPDIYDSKLTAKILENLVDIYVNSIKPLETAYNFNDLKHHVMNEGEVFSLPMILLLGPWSTGKSTLINYILGIENTSFSLDAGAQPTTSDFIVLNHGEEPKSVEGKILVMEKSYSSLEKYGQPLLERLRSLKIPNEILKLVNFIDTPGVIENKKQQERGFPFIEICRWFIDRSDLILLVFDPSKMDIGAELEEIFMQLKGNEAKVRLILNKADTINSQELLRVYGSLFWNLSPLINITEPPKVYVSSFWSKHFQSISKEYQDMFILDEETLLSDIFEVMSNRLQNKMAFLRRHAILVRNHALMVDKYLSTLSHHRSFFQSANDVAQLISEQPDSYKIRQKVLSYKDVSERDLLPDHYYEYFFTLHSMDSFLALSKQCGFVSLCLLDAVEKVIYEELPALVKKVELLQSMHLCSQKHTCKGSNYKYNEL